MRPARIHGAPWDATLPIREGIPVFPGDPPPRLTRTASLSAGDPLQLSEVQLGCHLGTHLDAPAHFVNGGATVGDYGAGQLCGRVVVLDCTAATHSVEVEHVDLGQVQAGDHVVLRTRNTVAGIQAPFRENYVHVTEPAALAIAEHGVKLLGFDYYSLDAARDEALPSHRALAERGIPAVVMLDLNGLDAGAYFWVVAPLKLPSLEGSPARVLFFEADFEI